MSKKKLRQTAWRKLWGYTLNKGQSRVFIMGFTFLVLKRNEDDAGEFAQKAKLIYG